MGWLHKIYYNSGLYNRSKKQQEENKHESETAKKLF